MPRISSVSVNNSIIFFFKEFIFSNISFEKKATRPQPKTTTVRPGANRPPPEDTGCC